MCHRHCCHQWLLLLTCFESNTQSPPPTANYHLTTKNTDLWPWPLLQISVAILSQDTSFCCKHVEPPTTLVYSMSVGPHLLLLLLLLLLPCAFAAGICFYYYYYFYYYYINYLPCAFAAGLLLLILLLNCFAHLLQASVTIAELLLRPPVMDMTWPTSLKK